MNHSVSFQGPPVPHNLSFLDRKSIQELINQQAHQGGKPMYDGIGLTDQTSRVEQHSSDRQTLGWDRKKT